MSQADHASGNPKSASRNVPDGIAKGILGFVIGAGVTFLGMHFYGPREYIRVVVPSYDPPSIDTPLTQQGAATPGGSAPGGSDASGK